MVAPLAPVVHMEVPLQQVEVVEIQDLQVEEYIHHRNLAEECNHHQDHKEEEHTEVVVVAEEADKVCRLFHKYLFHHKQTDNLKPLVEEMVSSLYLK